MFGLEVAKETESRLCDFQNFQFYFREKEKREAKLLAYTPHRLALLMFRKALRLSDCIKSVGYRHLVRDPALFSSKTPQKACFNRFPFCIHKEKAGNFFGRHFDIPGA